MPQELIFGLIAPLGASLNAVENQLAISLNACGYSTETIYLGKEIASIYADFYPDPAVGQRLLSSEIGPLERILLLQDAGDALRIDSNRGDILAIAAIKKICALRKRKNQLRPRAYLIRSLKHPEEIQLLRAVYRERFYTVAAFSSRDQRIAHLQKLDTQQNTALVNALGLIERDYRRGNRQPGIDHLLDLFSRHWFNSGAAKRTSEDLVRFGQQLQRTFYLADLFVDHSDRELLGRHVQRFVRLIFGHNFTTPTREEFAMFQAKTVSLRSADLSRQVGAIIASKGGDIIASGVNEVPKFGGGLYWPDSDLQEETDHRDFQFFHDRDVDAMRMERVTQVLEQLTADGWKFTNAAFTEKEATIEILARRLRDLHLPESGAFGRTVHAEMAALMDAVSRGVCVRGQTMFATTFPCHQCAKHLLAAGIDQVIFIEPYPKSETVRLWPSEVADLEAQGEMQSDRLLLRPFVGIAPGRYMDFFLLDSSRAPRRRNVQGKRTVAKWTPRPPSSETSEEYFPQERDFLSRELHLIEQWKRWFSPSFTPPHSLGSHDDPFER